MKNVQHAILPQLARQPIGPDRQAIEEQFILDTLESYTTYNSYWRLLKTIESDPRYDRDKATYLLRSF